MSDLLYSCIGDRAATVTTAAPIKIDPSFLGTWQSTNAQTTGIARVEFSERDDRVFIRIYGADEDGLADWGEVEVDLFADQVDSPVGTKFRALYDFDFMEVRIHAWVKLGVLVLGIFNRFKDESGRVNYFDREFLAHATS